MSKKKTKYSREMIAVKKKPQHAWGKDNPKVRYERKETNDEIMQRVLNGSGKIVIRAQFSIFDPAYCGGKGNYAGLNGHGFSFELKSVDGVYRALARMVESLNKK